MLARKTVFLNLRDFSGQCSDLICLSQAAVQSKGYHLTVDSTHANFHVTLTILKIGTRKGEDRINFWKEINSKVAAEMSLLHHKRTERTTIEEINTEYEKTDNFTPTSHLNTDKNKKNTPPPNKNTTITRTDIAHTTIEKFSDVMMIVLVHITPKGGQPTYKTLIVTGRNIYGGFHSIHYEDFMDLTYHKLKMDMALAIASLF